MKQKYNKTLYSNQLTKLDLERVLEYLNKSNASLKQTNDFFNQYELNNNSITIYNNDKIVIQGKNIVGLCIELSLPYIKYEKPEEAKLIDIKSYIGCDEVGVGDYFGGIVCCSVYVDETAIKKLVTLNVDDSKKLTDEQIISLTPKIKKNCSYVTKVISPKEYNKLYEQYENAHVIKTYGHNYCIIKLRELTGNDVLVYMDEYCSEENYIKYLKKLGIEYNSLNKVDHFETKSESKYIAIAAASIIARYEFLMMIKKLINKLNEFDGLNFDTLPLGASNKKNILESIAKIEKVIGNDKLKYFIKTNFKK